MNWTKLKSSLIVITAILGINGSGLASTRLSDTLANQSAETILKMVLQRLPEQNPSSFNSYRAITHQRFRIKANLSPRAESLIDTTENTINQNNRNYLFSKETLTIQRRLKPDFIQFENLSARTEGKEDSLYTILAWQLSNISFLEPAVSFLDKGYLSPLANVALGNYDYHLSDSITNSGDTLCIIKFHPKVDKRFDGFIGTMAINKKALAIQQISARSKQYNPKEPLLVINQNFEQINAFWLPSERKIKVYLNKRSVSVQDNHLIAESITNIYQQEINPPLSPNDFSAAIQSPKNDHPTAVLTTGNYGYRPINQNDSLLQLRADSAIMAENRNQQTKLIRFITEGKIPLRYFNIDYNRIFGYNIYEGLKLGIGGETNRLLSKHFTVGGYISYGHKDRAVRNGEWINFYPSRSTDLRIQVAYKDVNMELGEPEFLETKTLLNPESYRYLLIKNMYVTKRYSAGIESRPFKALNYYLFGDLSENHSPQNTPYLRDHPFIPISLARTGLQIRYTPGIVLQMEDGRQKEMNIPKSDYYLTIIQGLSILSGEYHYTKAEFKGKFNLPSSGLGTTTIVFRGGAMSQEAPIIELFNGYGSFAGVFSLSAPYSFATMQLNEFSTANYTAVHLRHDFSTWLFPETSQKKPAFIFAQNIGCGQLNNQQLIKYNLKDYRKGFYESGFEVNNLLRMNYLSWGVGIYYRYGPYQFSSTHENFAYKFGFFFKL